MDPYLTHKDSIAGKTYRCDLFRGGFDGVIDTGIQTFALFIAIRYFNAGTDFKAIIAASPWLGMIFSLFLVHYAGKTGWKKSICGALPATIAAFCLFLTAWTNWLGLFTALIVFAYFFETSLIPFLTSIYNDNYPPNKRGQFFSKPARLNVGITILFSFSASKLLDWNLENYALVFSILGLCGFGKAYAIYSMPTKAIEPGHENPLSNFKYMIEDRSFGYVLLTWFIMGFANLWIQPLRIDYLTSAQWGIEAPASTVALIIGIIPSIMSLLFIPFWGRLFDRINFVALRIAINIIFATGIGMFFISKQLTLIGTGSALIGLAFTGGRVAWNLWITKYAPKGKATAYMSVHVCLTGIRGTIGPMIGFWAVSYLGPKNMGLLSAGLMLIATIMLIPELKYGKRTIS